MNAKGAKRTKDFSPDSGTYVDVIIINVSGPNIPAGQGFYQWQSNHNSTNPSTPPSAISLTVPQGSALVQVLLVESASSGNSGGGFFYGDASQSLGAGANDVDVTVALLGGVDASGNNNIAGRYLFADGVSGPTGNVSVYFTPPGNKPVMLVDQSNEIIGGWFRVFAIQGATLDYVSGDGTDLFGGPVAIDTVGFVASSGRVRIVTPPYYSSNNSSGTLGLQSPSMNVLGWFGPGAGLKPICYNSGTDSIGYAYTTNSTSGPNLQWVGATSAPATNVHPAVGGLASSTLDSNQVCTDGVGGDVRFVNYMSLFDQEATSGDEMLGFKGPFVAQMNQNGGSSFLSTSLSGSQLTLAWNFLPGVQSTPTVKVIDGVDLYGRIETSSQYNGGQQDYNGNNDGVLCASLTNLNFALLGSLAPTPVGAPVTSQSVTVDLTAKAAFQTAVSAGLTTIIACPYTTNAAGKKYFTSAAVSYPNGGTCSGTCNGPPPASSLALVSPQELVGLTRSIGYVANYGNSGNSCTPFIVRGLNGSTPASLPPGFGFSVTITGDTNAVVEGVYSGTSCGGNYFGYPGGSPTAGQWSGSTDQIISVLINGYNITPPTNTLTLTVNGLGANSSMQASKLITYTPPPSANVNDYSVYVLPQAPALQYACNTLLYLPWYDDGTTAMVATLSASTVSAMLPSFTGLTLYSAQSGPPCTQYVSPSLYLSPSNAVAMLDFMYTGTGALNLAPQNMVAGMVATGSPNITLGAAGAPYQAILTLQTPNGSNNNNYTVSANSCISGQVLLYDNHGNLTAPSTGNITFNIVATGGLFYQYSGCEGGTPSSTLSGQAFSPGVTTLPFYFMVSSPGTGSLAVSITSTPLPGGAPLPALLTINPPDNIAAFVTGQNFSPGSGVIGSSGLGWEIPGMLNICFYNPATDQVDQTINGYPLSGFSVSNISNTVPQGYSLNFINGCAMTSVIPNAGVMTVSANAYINGNSANLGPENFAVAGAPDPVILLLNGAAFTPGSTSPALGEFQSGQVNNYQICYVLPDLSAIDTSVNGVNILASSPHAYWISDSADGLTAGCNDGTTPGACGQFTNGCANSSLNVPSNWSGATAYLQVWGSSAAHTSTNGLVGTYVQ